MVTYKLPPVDEKGNLPQCITKMDGDVILGIPFAEGNTDYQAYLAWVAEGNTPEPSDEVNNV
jgi:hypothetical protein